MRIIICPVGTSILTNGAEPSAKKLLLDYANTKRREDIPPADAVKLDKVIDDRMAKLKFMNGETAKKASAELHSLLILFGEEAPAPNDVVYLVPTHTYIGRRASELISSYIGKLRVEIKLMEIPSLQTRSSEDLRSAFSLLVREIVSLHEAYKPMGARFIFNLTGGFKTVVGFLQTLATLYADETVYIFESESELMRVPKLPFSLRAEDYIVNQVELWRRLEMGLPVNQELAGTLPGTLYYRIDDSFMLSEYGEFIWLSLKSDLFSERIYPPPTGKARLGERFQSSVQNLNPSQKLKLNRRIDDLSKYLESPRQDMLKSLSFKAIGKSQGASTHEFYAWSDEGAKRVYCHYDVYGTLILDELGEHLS